MYYGLDISLKHFGLVEMSEYGSVQRYWFMTDVKKFADAECTRSLYYKQDKELDPESENYRRVNLILSFLFNRVAPIDGYIAIEAYGFATMSPKFAEIAEQTGIVKQWLVKQGARIRLHDPDSVKLFGAGNGHALKRHMVDAIKEPFFPTTLLKTVNKKIGVKNPQTVTEYDGPGTDLADAYWLAELLRTEILLRTGQRNLSDLTESQIRVFNRVTKAFPVNLLDRPFARYSDPC